MAISVYEKEGRKLWSVYVNLRSAKDHKIRLQKRVRAIESEETAIAEEKRLLRKLGEKVGKIEGQGESWAFIIGKWELDARKYKDHGPTTIRDYVACLEKWTKDWLKVSASTLTKGDGREILSNLEEAGKSVSFQKKVKLSSP